MSEQAIDAAERSGAAGYLALPQQGGGPGVLLLHAWWGLNDFFRGMADRLAGEGFVVLAPDIYGDGSTASTIEEAEKLSGKLDSDQAIARVQAGLDRLLQQPGTQGKRIGVIGFSMGAAYGIWLASLKNEVAAVVLFYGAWNMNDNYGKSTEAAFLGHFAENDQYESEEEIRGLEDNLRSAGREVAFHTYQGTGHWFFENDRPDAYNETAARQAWDRTVEFLHRQLG
jgi:carboxymethylenebutenolidase